MAMETAFFRAPRVPRFDDDVKASHWVVHNFIDMVGSVWQKGLTWSGLGLSGLLVGSVCIGPRTHRTNGLRPTLSSKRKHRQANKHIFRYRYRCIYVHIYMYKYRIYIYTYIDKYMNT
jgi:hypothetical protein